MSDGGYSLMRGGPVYRLLRSAGLLQGKAPVALWIAIVTVLVSMGPLVVACAGNGTLIGTAVEVPLLADYAVLVRFLLVLPLLVLVAPHTDMMIKRDLRRLHVLPLVRRGRAAELHGLLASMRRLRDANTPELLCLLLALSPSLLGMASLEALAGASSWRANADGSGSFAVHWFNIVSVTLFRFVAALWLWRFCLWVYLLWRLSRMDLVLRPTHPDGAGGIGFLGVAQQRFAILGFAGGILICGEVVNQVLHMGETVPSLKYLLLAYVVGATLFLVAPLALLMPTMLRVKRESMRRYDVLGYRMACTFDRRWGIPHPDEGWETLLDDDDASGMADYGGGPYQTAKGMSSMPMSRGNLLTIAFLSAVPLVPLVFLVIPLVDLLGRIFSTLL